MDYVEFVVRLPKDYIEDAADFGMDDPEIIAQMLREELEQRIMAFVDSEVKAHRHEKRAGDSLKQIK